MVLLFMKSIHCLRATLTPMGDQDRISPYNIKMIPKEKMMGTKKYINLGDIG